MRGDGRFGKPCNHGHRITVQEMLEWLSIPEPNDFLAVTA